MEPASVEQEGFDFPEPSEDSALKKRKRTSAEVKADKEAAAKARADAKAARIAEHGAARNRLIAAYFEAYEKARGRKPIFDAQSGAAIWRLLEKCGWDDAMAAALVRRVYEDDFNKDRVSIIEISAKPSSFDHEPRKKFVAGRFLQKQMPLTHPRGASVLSIDDV